MNVKRTSYFTFLVAITTLATVASCNKVKEQALYAAELHAADAIYRDNHPEIFDLCLEGLGKMDYRFEIAKVLRDKGLKTGKFKLAIDQSGTLSVYLVIDKDYKGPVSASIFDSKSHHYGRTALLSGAESDNIHAYGPAFDKRAGIASKNRILRE